MSGLEIGVTALYIVVLGVFIFAAYTAPITDEGL
jgi:hypothetical protein